MSRELDKTKGTLEPGEMQEIGIGTRIIRRTEQGEMQEMDIGTRIKRRKRKNSV